MAAVTRDDLNAALDNIDALKSTRGTAKVENAAAVQAKAAADQAATEKAAALVQANSNLALAVSDYAQLLAEYTADTADNISPRSVRHTAPAVRPMSPR